MNSPVVFVLLALICVSASEPAMENLIGTEIQKCLNCLCHARSGCWNRLNCARYSISKDYWKAGGSKSEGTHADPDEAYKSCMKNENCILNTIKTYTESFGPTDCNCDGVFDCKDMFAIHLFGKSCYNPKFGSTYAKRFNHCASTIGVNAMLESEGSCDVPDVEAV